MVRRAPGVTVPAAGTSRMRLLPVSAMKRFPAESRSMFQGLATNARLASPWNIDLDSAGNLFIADTGNNRIREVPAAGTVTPGARLTITTTQLTPPLGTPSNLALQSVGGTGPLTWTIVGGSLPPGLVFNNGVITGTATASGSFNVTVQVHDSGTPQQVTEGVVVLQVSASAPGGALSGAAASGLIGWWPAEGNADDISGGNNGTVGSEVTFAPGKVGQGFSFAGIPFQSPGSVVTVPDAPDLGLTAVTIEGWIQMNAPPPASASYAVVTKGVSATTENYGLYVKNIDGLGT